MVQVPGVVERLEYDPNRSGHIALVRYEARPKSESLAYIIAPEALKPGDTVQASRQAALEIAVGNAMPLRHIPLGTKLHNIESKPGRGPPVCPRPPPLHLALE